MAIPTVPGRSAFMLPVGPSKADQQPSHSEINSPFYNSNTSAISHHMPSGSGSGLNTSISTTRTLLTSVSPSVVEGETKFTDLKHYIALGSLHYDQNLQETLSVAGSTTMRQRDMLTTALETGLDWLEILSPVLPIEVKQIIGIGAMQLLDARWIRMFLNLPKITPGRLHSIVRVYLLPEDWGRRFIDRNSKHLRATLRQLFEKVDISSEAWHGDYSEAAIRHFDPWASVENRSLFYLFNKLPSPAPTPEMIKNRFSRRAVEGLLSPPASVSPDEELAIEALKSKLYPYQARSASLMIQREAAPQLQLDPRLEVRQSPNGESFFYSARDGSFLQEPRYYETNRGGILAETMGLGKTIICLSVILSTRGHLPQIPAAYMPPPKIRTRVGSLKDVAASIMNRYSIPAKDALERKEVAKELDLSKLKDTLQQNMAYYEIPTDVPRMNRTTRITPPRQFIPCSGTIIVVPRHLLHQWQSEIRKHITGRGLKVLVMDSVAKRSKSKPRLPGEDLMEFQTELPPPTELMEFDVVLFSRNRFDQEIEEKMGPLPGSNYFMGCQCPYIGPTRLSDCISECRFYKSPLKKIHWLRIIIDEGHNFSSSMSNAVSFAKQLQAERRWVVSGTPVKNLVGVEMDLLNAEEGILDQAALRNIAMEQRKAFSIDEESTKAAKALGSLASNFLRVRPWSDSSSEGKLDWDEYIYRHEHQHRKTYSGFSSCFVRTLEGLIVKTRADDVEKDMVLPPMKHRVVYLKPCWFDKMTANMFIQVLRANAITSEREDVDYLFHKNSLKAKHSLIRNLRQSNFTWTGFSLEDVASTIKTSSKYVANNQGRCSLEDAQSLLESSGIVTKLMTSKSWTALEKAHEVGLAVNKFPQDCEESFSLVYPEKPTMIGVTQLLDGQLHVDSHILGGNPSEGLNTVGLAAKTRIAEIAKAENAMAGEVQLKKTGVPSSCIGLQPVTSRRASTLVNKASPTNSQVPKKLKPTKTTKTNIISFEKAEPTFAPSKAVEPLKGEVQDEQEDVTPIAPVRPRKRKLTLSDELAELPQDSPLRDTCVVGTTSAKLSYLITKVMKHQATEKIIIFYDGDNAAYYIAQCLEMLYVNHRIYARTLDNTKRSEYVALFNENPDVRVLLIDVACGALGLNLNAASVVLIVNPINRPEIEAQAIKRAHRIGQTKEVLVETLVLQGTMEEAIFKRAKNMSRQQHQEAKELEDDAGITDIIQNAEILPIDPGVGEGFNMFAPLEVPEQIFGRVGREKYHRYGVADAKEPKTKKAKVAKKDAAGSSLAGPTSRGQELGVTQPVVTGADDAVHASGVLDDTRAGAARSLFGSGL
jgi:SNF2 family DNA or RNA helicase